MRSRTQEQTIATTLRDRTVFPDPPVFDQSYVYTYSYVSSLINDYPENAFSNKDCYHRKAKWDVAGLFLPSAVSVPDGQGRTNTHTLSYTTNIYHRAPYLEPEVNIDYTVALDALLADAVGSTNQSVSTLINIIELRQLKGLMPSLLKGFKTLIKRGFRSKLSWKELSGSYLAKSFGLDPLVSDFRGAMNIRENVSRRIKELEDRNGKIVRLNKRAPISPPESSSSAWDTIAVDNNLPLTQWRAKRYREFKIDSICVGCDVQSFFVNNAESQSKLWAQALGLSSPLVNAWEIVPFSFVVDWFIPIGQTFQRLENKLGLHETVKSCVMTNFTHSYKWSLVDRHYLRLSSKQYPSWDGLSYQGPAYTCSVYQRRVGIPPTSILTAPSGWSLSKTALSIALIMQRA